MPLTTVTAVEGDSLCSLARAFGLLDCGSLRALAENNAFLNRPLKARDVVTMPELTVREESGATEQRHRFQLNQSSTGTIRFVHGSKSKPYAEDDTLEVLNVSKYITDKGGDADGSQPFPGDTIREFDARADKDLDAFKVEVFDPRLKKSEIDIVIEALRPVYDAAKVVVGHKEFDGSLDDPSTERGKRSLKAKASKQGVTNTMRYRTPYLRLVVDEADKSGTVGPVATGGFPPASNSQPKPKQTILVTDMVDQGDDQVEILDQRIRARYEFDACPATSNKCAAIVEKSVGTDRQRLRVNVNVLRQTVDGVPLVKKEDARRRVLKWCRRIFAQASLSPKLLDVREVNPVENLVCVSGFAPGDPANAGGRRAAGDGQLGFTINAAGKPSQVVGPITPAAGDDALASASALAALVQPPYTAQAALNARRRIDALGSADILIKETSGVPVTLSAMVSSDSAQLLSFGNVNPLPAASQSWDGDNFLAGVIGQRILLRNFDTGDDRVDVFVINTTTSGNRGEAMMSGHSLNPDATAQGRPAIKFSLFAIRSSMDATDNDPLVLAHEIGHVAGEILHAVTATHQLMHAQVTGNNAVGASKRIRNGAVRYDNSNATGFNLLDRVRLEGAGLLEPW